RRSMLAARSAAYAWLLIPSTLFHLACTASSIDPARFEEEDGPSAPPVPRPGTSTSLAGDAEATGEGETDDGDVASTTLAVVESTGVSLVQDTAGSTDEGDASTFGSGEPSDEETCPAGTVGCACRPEGCAPGSGCVDGRCFDGCGDGHLDPGEACDDGNRVDDDACTNACALPRCGDGIVQG